MASPRSPTTRHSACSEACGCVPPLREAGLCDSGYRLIIINNLHQITFSTNFPQDKITLFSIVLIDIEEKLPPSTNTDYCSDSELECCSCPSSKPCAGPCHAVEDLTVAFVLIHIISIFILIIKVVSIIKMIFLRCQSRGFLVQTNKLRPISVA